MIKKLLIVVLVAMVSSCSTLQKELKNYVKQPEVNYKSFAIGSVSMDAIELIPTFNVANKNNFSLPINTITYELSLNNKKMLAGETKEIGSLAANKDKDVSLSIDLTKETLTSFQQLLFKDKKLDYSIKGDVNAMGLSIPFEESATLYVPEIKVGDVKVNSATFEKVDIVLSLEIDNQNDFSLPLDDVNYSVLSKGDTLFTGSLNNQKIAKGKTVLQLPLSIKPSDLFSNVFSMLLNPELPLTIEINTPLFSKSYDHSLNLNTFFR